MAKQTLIRTSSYQKMRMWLIRGCKFYSSEDAYQTLIRAVTLQENSHFATLHLRQLWDNCRKAYFLRNLQRFVRRFWQPSQMLLLKPGMKFTLAEFEILSNKIPCYQKKLKPLFTKTQKIEPTKLSKRRSMSLKTHKTQHRCSKFTITPNP
jgi:hypothetical protein